jgi:hypothetical protein
MVWGRWHWPGWQRPTGDPSTLEAESATVRANLLAAYGIEPLAEDKIADAKGAPK